MKLRATQSFWFLAAKALCNTAVRIYEPALARFPRRTERVGSNFNQSGMSEDLDVSHISHRGTDQGEVLCDAGLGLFSNPLRPG